jgi:hypothetical protein
MTEKGDLVALPDGSLSAGVERTSSRVSWLTAMNVALLCILFVCVLLLVWRQRNRRRLDAAR